MLRELNRGGQIYFVHNRVHDIEKVAHKLAEIVPEARIGIGHGQMPEGELERVMLDFVDHQFDILLATTIVESGLDIPNANTIFIDEADRYGLADLHQLRGRVGRYKHRAYCYLLVDPHRHLSTTAARRLRAIEEFSQMGSGFAIAMRDLEMRGAGNILGTQQSGHIATVGYELYCELLEQAVRKLKHLPPKVTVDVSVDLPCEAYIPRTYVPDMRLKIDLYRRVARLATIADWEDLSAELVDRFGPRAAGSRAHAAASKAADLGPRLGHRVDPSRRRLRRAALHRPPADRAARPKSRADGCGSSMIRAPICRWPRSSFASEQVVGDRAIAVAARLSGSYNPAPPRCGALAFARLGSLSHGSRVRPRMSVRRLPIVSGEPRVQPIAGERDAYTAQVVFCAVHPVVP